MEIVKLSMLQKDICLFLYHAADLIYFGPLQLPTSLLWNRCSVNDTQICLPCSNNSAEHLNEIPTRHIMSKFSWLLWISSCSASRCWKAILPKYDPHFNFCFSFFIQVLTLSYKTLLIVSDFEQCKVCEPSCIKSSLNFTKCQGRAVYSLWLIL